MEENFRYLYFLSKIKNLGNVLIKNICEIYVDFDSFMSAKTNDFKSIALLNEKRIASIEEARKNSKVIIDETDNILDKLQTKKIDFTTILSENYPANLKRIYDPPLILYFKGTLNENDIYSLGIVGTRNPSLYGMNMCEILVKELSALKIIIVSGMALGIDSMAHKTCINNDNITYAVLGSGLDVIYPSSNRHLYDQIQNHGAVISEYIHGTKPDKMNFPKRNRIISGISLGTLIIESGIKGGSLITANMALDQNKEVFALPGNINSKKSEGTNELIKRGNAKLITKVDDILNELDYSLKNYLKRNGNKNVQIKNLELDIFERKIYDILTNEPIHIDIIQELTEMSISDCLVYLLSLEFKDCVKQLPGKYFIRK